MLSSIKHRFGNNSLQIEFDGDGAFLSGLAGVESVDAYGQFVEIKLQKGADPQDILKASVGRLVIRRFEVVSPTLHKIFIQQVGPEATNA